MIARRVLQALLLAVLVSAGAYLLVYLYRWEWHRALVAGVFLVAAEIALLASAISRRLQGIEERLERQERSQWSLPAQSPVASPPMAPTPRDRLREAAPERRRPFAWLDPERGQLNVFVPVLMGAGVVLSAVAWLVERLGAATAGVTLERRLAHRLDGLALPAGGLLAGPLPSPADGSATVSDGAGRRRAARVVVGALATLAVVAGIDVLGDATQTRPEPYRADSVTEVVVRIGQRGHEQPVGRAADALWGACRGALAPEVSAAITPLGPDRALLELAPAIGDHGRRRFTGCLADATLDNVQGTVLSLSTRPAG